MKFAEIYEEKTIPVTGISDASTADLFLSKMDKRDIADAYPAVAKKLSQLNSVIKNLKSSDPRNDTLKDAADRLNVWISDHPLTKMSNPAGANINLIDL